MKIAATVIGLYILLSLILTPIQYRYLKGVQEEQRKKKISNNDYFDNMSFQEEVLHANTQGNPMFFLANLFAWLILKKNNSSRSSAD